MQDQFRVAEKNGELWSQAYDIIKNAIGEDGELVNESHLVSLLQDSEAFKTMSKFGQASFIKDLATTWKSAQVGLSNLHMSEARLNGSLTLDNNKTLTYDSENNKWLDDKGNEYTGISWDEKNQHLHINLLRKMSQQRHQHNKKLGQRYYPIYLALLLFGVVEMDGLKKIRNNYNEVLII